MNVVCDCGSGNIQQISEKYGVITFRCLDCGNYFAVKEDEIV